MQTNDTTVGQKVGNALDMGITQAHKGISWVKARVDKALEDRRKAKEEKHAAFIKEIVDAIKAEYDLSLDDEAVARIAKVVTPQVIEAHNPKVQEVVVQTVEALRRKGVQGLRKQA